MSVSKVLKKGYAKVFNTESVSCLFVGAAMLAGPAYLIGDAINPDLSTQRTPGLGDRQFEGLDKDLTKMLTFKKQAEEVRGTARQAQQELMASPGNVTLTNQVAVARTQEKDHMLNLEALKESFLPRVMVSEGISEKDAYALFDKYRDAFGPHYNSLDGFMTHDVGHLDECQAKVMGGTSDINKKTADDISFCMSDSTGDREIGTAFASFAYLILAINLLIPGFFGVGTAFRKELAEEERSKPKQKDTVTDEVNLKIKIDKPRR